MGQGMASMSTYDLTKELEEARVFAKDYFGAMEFIFNGADFAWALAGCLRRGKYTPDVPPLTLFDSKMDACL